MVVRVATEADAAACALHLGSAAAARWSATRAAAGLRASDLLAELPVDRVLLELSEHDQVDDYDAIAALIEQLAAAV